MSALVGSFGLVSINASAYTNYFESNGDDLIVAVGTFFNAGDVDYEIRIYVNNVEVHRQSGKSLFSGYNTIEPDKLIAIKKGDIFAVEVLGNIIPLASQTRRFFEPVGLLLKLME